MDKTQLEINVFFGHVSPNSACLYAQVRSLAGGGDWTLRGTVRGPRSEFAHTLQASFTFRDLGEGPNLLAEARLTDPCFWSPRLPALYDVRIELCCRGTVHGTLEQSQGIRLLGTRSDNLMLEGQRWVLRGVHTAATRPTDLPDWRELSAAMIVDDPSDQQCGRASDQGVWLVACVRDPARVAQSLQRLRRWAAAAVVVLPEGVQSAETLKSIAPNVLLAQWCAGFQPVSPAQWADLALCEVDEPAGFPDIHRDCTLPIIAVRRVKYECSLADARRACDHLQRDLAPHGDYAGYVV